MTFPPLSGGDHSILSSEYCSGYTDVAGIWNTGFYCPQTGSTLAVYCCGTATYKYCCTDKPLNGTGAGVVEDVTIGTRVVEGSAISIDGAGLGDGNDYSGATRMRPVDEGMGGNDLGSLNLSDVPIIFGVACGVAAVLILVILTGLYLTSCCAHYHQLHQNRKRRSSTPGIYRGAQTANASTTSNLVNLYSPTNSGRVGATQLDNTQTYIVHHQHPIPASPDSISTSVDHYQMGSASLATTPLDIEWSSSHQYFQSPQQMQNPTSSSTSLMHQQHPLNLLSGGMPNNVERIHYTVHQTQNRLAVALTGSMNRLSDRPSPCPTPSSSYQVNIPLTPPDGYSYPRQSYRVSPPPQYSSAILARAESPPYYPSYDSGSSSNNTDNQHNYLSRTSTLPLSLSRKPPSGARALLTSPIPYGSNLGTPQQPKSILRTSQNYRRVVTNETPPPGMFPGPSYLVDGGQVAYRNVDSRTNLSSHPMLLLESNLELGKGEEVDNNVVIEEITDEGKSGSRRASLSVINRGQDEEEESEERRDTFDIHDIDSDALSRLIEMDLDSKL